MADQSIPVTVLDETTSTNLSAQSLFHEGRTEPLWVLARRQTAGVGRRCRPWQTGEGNFAGTLIWPVEPAQTSRPALFSFIAGLSVVDAAEKNGILQGKLKLKWPNDVLLEGAKLCGILASLLTGPTSMAVMIGIGVNLKSAPSDPDLNATALNDHLVKVPQPEAFCADLDQSFRSWWHLYEKEGFAAIRNAWLSLAAGLGEPLTARLQEETLQGTFRGLDAQGALQLETDDGQVKTLLAADIFLGQPRRDPL